MTDQQLAIAMKQFAKPFDEWLKNLCRLWYEATPLEATELDSLLSEAGIHRERLAAGDLTEGSRRR